MSLKATDEIHIDPTKIKQLLVSIRNGSPIKIALARAGIPYYIYNIWLGLYNDYIKELDNNKVGALEDIKELEPTPLYSNKPNESNKIVGFRFTPISIISKIKQEFSVWVEDTLTHVQTATPKFSFWQNYAFLLERRCKDEFSREETINTNNDNKIDKVVIQWIDPKEDADRLKKLEEEVKASLDGN